MDKMIRLENGAATGNDTQIAGEDNILLRELAALDPLAYDRQRKDAARQLGVGVSALDKAVALRGNGTDRGVGTELLFEDPPRWDEPLAGGDLLSALADTLRRYIVLPYTTLSWGIRDTANRAGLDGLWLHDLRRTRVVTLTEAGCSTAEIGAITGHSDQSVHRMMRTYLPKTFTMARNAITKLEKNG